MKTHSRRGEPRGPAADRRLTARPARDRLRRGPRQPVAEEDGPQGGLWLARQAARVIHTGTEVTSCDPRRGERMAMNEGPTPSRAAEGLCGRRVKGKGRSDVTA